MMISSLFVLGRPANFGTWIGGSRKLIGKHPGVLLELRNLSVTSWSSLGLRKRPLRAHQATSMNGKLALLELAVHFQVAEDPTCPKAVLPSQSKMSKLSLALRVVVPGNCIRCRKGALYEGNLSLFLNCQSQQSRTDDRKDDDCSTCCAVARCIKQGYII